MEMCLQLNMNSYIHIKEKDKGRKPLPSIFHENLLVVSNFLY